MRILFACLQDIEKVRNGEKAKLLMKETLISFELKLTKDENGFTIASVRAVCE